ncbi:hypothetical protein PoB_000784400 [Plakobranchus ocellatus]|uniref:Uncharacterized protein n=1 Tax=Plakobranchus ocellatus TaxID=259542 RepID=A0AAV3YH40_9GAST|nr:hypothetical protein PoB_000784400 [Plakobranchus ocellatus]
MAQTQTVRDWPKSYAAAVQTRQAKMCTIGVQTDAPFPDIAATFDNLPSAPSNKNPLPLLPPHLPPPGQFLTPPTTPPLPALHAPHHPQQPDRINTSGLKGSPAPQIQLGQVRLATPPSPPPPLHPAPDSPMTQK